MMRRTIDFDERTKGRAAASLDNGAPSNGAGRAPVDSTGQHNGGHAHWQLVPFGRQIPPSDWRARPALWWPVSRPDHQASSRRRHKPLVVASVQIRQDLSWTNKWRCQVSGASSRSCGGSTRDVVSAQRPGRPVTSERLFIEHMAIIILLPRVSTGRGGHLSGACGWHSSPPILPLAASGFAGHGVRSRCLIVYPPWRLERRGKLERSTGAAATAAAAAAA